MKVVVGEWRTCFMWLVEWRGCSKKKKMGLMWRWRWK